MGRLLGDGLFRWGLWWLLDKSRNFISRGLDWISSKKRITWGRLLSRALDTHRRYMQNRVKIRFEHMNLRLRNFHRGVDLNILTPLTMQTRIVSIGRCSSGMIVIFPRRFSIKFLLANIYQLDSKYVKYRLDFSRFCFNCLNYASLNSEMPVRRIYHWRHRSYTNTLGNFIHVSGNF